MASFPDDPLGNSDDDLDETEEDVARRQLGWFLANAAHSPLLTRFQSLLVRQVRKILDAPEDDIDSDSDDLDEIAAAARPLYHANRAVRRRAARKLLKTYDAYPSGDDPVETNLAYAAGEFGFDPVEVSILRLVVTYRQNAGLECFADELSRRLRQPAQAIAAMIGEVPGIVAERLDPKSRLISSGFLVLNPDADRYGLSGDSGVVQMAKSLARVTKTHFASREAWLAAVCGEPAAATLEWEDFAHIGAASDLALRMLAGAVGSGERGINILLYGEVGTGKTEFCKTLAAQLNVPIWQVGETDVEGAEPTRNERISAFRLAQRLLARRKRALIMLDEAEEMIEGFALGASLVPTRGRTGSKVYINRLLEQNEVPVLWICNDLDTIHAAVRRRMTLAIEVRTPNASVRARIWRKAVAAAGADIGEADIEWFARTFDAPPAVVANATRAAKLAGGGAKEAATAIAGSLRLLGRRPALAPANTGEFDPALTNCAQDLEHLAQSVCRPGAPKNWSICIHGPAGTGKSYFARHLAGQLGMEVTPKRASDLLSMWVGGNEQNIAAAFAEARADGTLLVFDEADSLLADRGFAVRNWEVSQVNEMLTWMESHPLPFVCTTNLVERLDKASLRRFTFKLTFETLTTAQAALTFERFFGLKAPGRLPEGLAPGDFAVVRRKRAVLATDDPAMLVRWLEEEVEAKGPRSRPIGFGR